MAARISITTSRELQSRAASLLSQYLAEELNCPHAFIGGFAWSLLGSPRLTEISPVPRDILIEADKLDLLELRKKLETTDERFASAGIRWYFVHEPVQALRGEELVRASRDNVLIETLKTGTWGLPVVAEPTYSVDHPSGTSFVILYPPVLLLTKMKRWYTSHESTRPKTMSKTLSDKKDLDYLIFWLSDNDMKIDFELYKGKEKPELLKVVRAYRNKFQDNAVLMEALQEVLHKEDWDALQAAPEVLTSACVVPPEATPETQRTESALPSELIVDPTSQPKEATEPASRATTPPGAGLVSEAARRSCFELASSPRPRHKRSVSSASTSNLSSTLQQPDERQAGRRASSRG